MTTQRGSPHTAQDDDHHRRTLELIREEIANWENEIRIRKEYVEHAERRLQMAEAGLEAWRSTLRARTQGR